MTKTPPHKFFGLLKWLDGRPLTDMIEPYRQRIFEQALFTLDGNRPQYNLVLTGRAKKNWKSVDLILAALYRLLAWKSALGNQCYILANDEGQAGDDLEIAKKLIRVNPVLSRKVTVKQKTIVRNDDAGFLEILPAGDVAGSHGKTYSFCGFDEIHPYRSWDIMEAMQLDPHRPDAMLWITSYASLFNYPGVPLYDLTLQGKGGLDPRMYFSWYGADYCTDPEFAALESPEARANPSVIPNEYLDQQRKRLPAHKYRRLHLNIPGAPEGAYFAPERIEDAVKEKYSRRPFDERHIYKAFVDMSGGSGDDATLGIGHREDDRILVDGVWNQGHRPPFDPRKAVSTFADILQGYRLRHVRGDKYAGETFISDFASHGIGYSVSPLPKSGLYEALEVELNGGRVFLPDDPILFKQLMTLVMRGGKIDHPSGEHDDFANVVAGCVHKLRAGASDRCWVCGKTTEEGCPQIHEAGGGPIDEAAEARQDERVAVMITDTIKRQGYYFPGE